MSNNENPIGDVSRNSTIIFDPSLDKLAQLSPGFLKPSKNAEFEGNLTKQPINYDSLRRRAFSKYFTSLYLPKMAGLNSNLQASYKRTLECASVIKRFDGSTTSSYCKNRWCLVCARIATAKFMNQYKDQIDNYPDPHMVVLSRPNVKAEHLKDEIATMNHLFTNIRKDLHKHKLNIQGVRKLEATFNDQVYTYHPHYHVLVSNQVQGLALIDHWLKRNPTSSSSAQHITSVTSNPAALKEVFKYFTKILSSNYQEKSLEKTVNQDNRRIYFKALDTIFQSMYGKRIFQTYGMKVPKSDVAATSDTMTDSPFDLFVWSNNDWLDKSTGELLTDFTPSNALLQLQKCVY